MTVMELRKILFNIDNQNMKVCIKYEPGIYSDIISVDTMIRNGGKFLVIKKVGD